VHERGKRERKRPQPFSSPLSSVLVPPVPTVNGGYRTKKQEISLVIIKLCKKRRICESQPVFLCKAIYLKC